MCANLLTKKQLKKRAKEKRYALKVYRKATVHNDIESQETLGFLYKFGKGLPKSDKDAVKWYRKAANSGRRSAQYLLGEMYWSGYGLINDENISIVFKPFIKIYNYFQLRFNWMKAVRWYHKAAMQGDGNAMARLGEAYSEGKGVLKNDKVSQKWYREGTILGNCTCYFAYRDNDKDRIAGDWYTEWYNEQCYNEQWHNEHFNQI